MPRRQKKSKQKGRGGGNSADKAIMTSHKSAASAFAQLCTADLRIRPPKLGIVEIPPKNFENKVYWFRDVSEVSVNYTAGGAVFAADQFVLTNFFSLATLVPNFDQYCIYSITARFTFEINNSTVTAGTFGSVIDHDSATIPTNWGSLENYSNFEMMPIVAGATQTRYIKPCVTPFVFQSGTSVTSFTVARQWIDAADASVPHFGIKYAVHGNTSAFTGRVYYSAVAGFRNKL